MGARSDVVKAGNVVTAGIACLALMKSALL